MAYDPWSAYGLHEEEHAAAAGPEQQATAGDDPEPSHSDPGPHDPGDDAHGSPANEGSPHSNGFPRDKSLSLGDEEGEMVLARAPDAAALLTAVGRVMDVLETERRQIEILREERRQAEREREAARIQAARLEAELVAERTRREGVELELMKAKRDLYGDEARLRAARLEALVEVEAARRQELQADLEETRAELDAASRRRWWRRSSR